MNKLFIVYLFNPDTGLYDQLFGIFDNLTLALNQINRFFNDNDIENLLSNYTIIETELNKKILINEIIQFH